MGRHLRILANTFTCDRKRAGWDKKSWSKNKESLVTKWKRLDQRVQDTTRRHGRQLKVWIPLIKIAVHNASIFPLSEPVCDCVCDYVRSSVDTLLAASRSGRYKLHYIQTIDEDTIPIAVTGASPTTPRQYMSTSKTAVSQCFAYQNGSAQRVERGVCDCVFNPNRSSVQPLVPTARSGP